MRKLTLSFVFLCALLGGGAVALAQQPLSAGDSTQAVGQDWQGVSIAQAHLAQSVSALVADLQAARAKIEALTKEVQSLKATPDVTPKAPPAP